MASLEIIPVFLASPSDLSDERKVAFEVIEQVNRQVAGHLGLRLDMYGWEFEAPGYGRAQGHINPHVDEADLFIGLIWRRWGTPSGDGHSSGFEEEYDRAVARASEGGPPVIWLFFKDVDAEQQHDAGPQLQTVLEFQRRVQEEHEAYYQRFADLQDWRTRLYGLLAEFIAKRAKASSTGEPDRSTGRSRVDAPLSARAAAASVPGVAQQLQALDAVRAAVGGEPAAQPSLFHVTRLLLASFRWVSDQQTAETLDTHETNLMYKLRAELDVTELERLQLVRSMLTGHGVRPGWFWLSGFDGLDPAHVLVYVATKDANPLVRQRAVEFIGDPRMLVGVSGQGEELHIEAVLRGLLSDDVPEVGAAALNLAAQLDTDEALELLRAAQTTRRPEVLRTSRSLGRCSCASRTLLSRLLPRTVP